MAKDNLTLALDGEVSIEDFSTAVSGLNRLIKSLTDTIVGKTSDIDWIVTDLVYSSAIATITGVSHDPQSVQSVIQGYWTVGQALEGGKQIPYNRNVAKAANQIMKVLKPHRISAVRFETPDNQAIIRPETTKDTRETTQTSFGAIEGRIQTLSDRKGIKFTLYDSIADKAISCYLDEEQRDILIDKWGHRAIVQGVITRDALTGRATAIRKIKNIEVLPEIDPTSFREARGFIRLEEPSEVLIRRLRDE